MFAKRPTESMNNHLRQSGERLPRPSSRLLGEETHHAAEVLVQLTTAKQKTQKRESGKAGG